MKIIKTIAIIYLLSMAGINLFAASIEVFPADLRQDKSVYCIGNEISPVHFILYSDRACGGKPGRHRIKDFNASIESAKISFSVDIPQEMKYLGIVDMRDDEFDAEDKAEKITIAGKEYIRHTIPLKHDMIIDRIVKGRHRYDINLWLRLPEKYEGEIKWRLLKNGKELVAAQNSIKTVGTLAGMSGSPSNFIFFMTYPEPSLPPEIIDSRIALLKKTGVSHVTFNYSDREFSANRIAYIQKLKAAGINIVFQKSGSYGSERKLLSNASKSGQGLYSAAQQTYDAITYDMNKEMLGSFENDMDGVLLDYEHHGASAHPAYDYAETAAAFAKAKGLNDIPTASESKSKYSSEYIKFRDLLIMKPIFGVASLSKSVKPGTTYFMEQGSGIPVGSKLDYKMYDEVVSYHLPMIYTSPLDFYHRVKLTADYVGKDKLLPVTCAGFTDNNNKVLSRSRQGELLLDYIGTASQGIAGIKHWPGAYYLDGGQLYDFCQGANLLAKIEGFYSEGEEDNTITATGLPYVEKTIEIGGQSIDISRPQWKSNLIVSIKRKDTESLITLLNYDRNEDAYVKITVPQAKRMHI